MPVPAIPRGRLAAEYAAILKDAVEEDEWARETLQAHFSLWKHMDEHQAPPHHVDEFYPASETCAPLRLVTPATLHTLRPILCEWMMHLCHDHGFERGTSLRAVYMLDDYLRDYGDGVSRENLQALGAACVLLASKLYSTLRARQCEFKRDRDLAVALARYRPALAQRHRDRHDAVNAQHQHCFRELFYFEETELARTCLPAPEETEQDLDQYNAEVAQNVLNINYFENQLKDQHRDNYFEAPDFMRLVFSNLYLLYPRGQRTRAAVLEALSVGDFVLAVDEVALFDQPRHGDPSAPFVPLDVTSDARMRLYRDCVVRLDLYYCLGSYRCVSQSLLAAVVFADALLAAPHLAFDAPDMAEMPEVVRLVTGFTTAELDAARRPLGSALVERELGDKLKLDCCLSTPEDPEYYFVKWCALGILAPE